MLGTCRERDQRHGWDARHVETSITVILFVARCDYHDLSWDVSTGKTYNIINFAREVTLAAVQRENAATFRHVFSYNLTSNGNMIGSYYKLHWQIKFKNCFAHLSQLYARKAFPL